MLDLMCSGLPAVRERVAFSTCLSICDHYTFSRNRLYNVPCPDDLLVPTWWSASKGPEAAQYAFLSSLLVRMMSQSIWDARLSISSDLTSQLLMDTPTLTTPSNSEPTRPSSAAALPHVTWNSVYRMCGSVAPEHFKLYFRLAVVPL